jgi:hypothetical protein
MKFKVRLTLAALLAAGCGGDVAEDPTVTTASAITDAQGTEVPLGLELLNGLPMEAHRWEHEGLHCDATPERTTVEVCGKTLPADLHLAWSDCTIRPHMRGPRPPPPDGAGGLPPPPDGTGGMPPPPPDGRAGEPPPSLLSSGTVDVVATVEPVGECGENTPIRVQRQSTHAIQHALPEGGVMALSGTVTSISVKDPGATSHARSSTFDVTRARRDAEGNTVESFHIAGTLEVTRTGSGESSSQTSQGTLQVTRPEGGEETVTLSAIVRVPPPVCAWPIGGTLQRTTADGTTHVVTFGPECGQATLDGEAITLPERPHGRGPGGRRPGGDGGPMGGR